MGAKPSQAIVDDVAFYTDLCHNSKTIAVNPIELDEFKANHKKTRTKSVIAKHVQINDELLFMVESNKTNHRDYKFKLFCLSRYNHPFFRFDSDGLAHKNTDPNIPLKDQSVTTPHFHFYNSLGVEVAYKTATLNNTGDTEALLDDIDFGTAHFCNEAQLSLDKGGFPTVIQIPSSELHLISNVVDPMRNISFD